MDASGIIGVGRHQKERVFGSYAAMMPTMVDPFGSPISTTLAFDWISSLSARIPTGPISALGSLLHAASTTTDMAIPTAPNSSHDLISGTVMRDSVRQETGRGK